MRRRTKNFLFLILASSFFFSFSQKDSLKTFKVKKPYVFEIADFYSVIRTDTSRLAVISEKYFSEERGAKAGRCNKESQDSVLKWANADMMIQVCTVHGRVQSIKLTFSKDNYLKNAIIQKQLGDGNFILGMSNKGGKIITTEYTNRQSNLFVETKCQGEDVVFIKFN